MHDVAYPLATADGEARASVDLALERRLTILFGAAILVSSWLLFLVQPMFAKMVLPRLGGTPAVWNTCVVFFQATLLVGYLYAHLTTRWLGVRRQALVHLVVLVLPLFALPIAVTSNPPPADGTPVWWLLGVLGLSVGLPFFVVSTTSPLLQRWFSTMPHRAAKDPYFLYSSSNFASLLALVSYPAIIEPSLRLADQSRMWTWAYAVFVALVAACAVSLRSWGRQGLVHDEVESSTSAAAVATAAPDTAAPAPAWGVRLRWLAFSFVPSSLMLGVTTHISTDIAAVPLLWVVPLALYLATFMLVFARRPLVPVRGLARLLPFAVIATVISMMFPSRPWWLIFLHLTTFFMAALVCHSRLAATRPAPRHLTEFYLWMSVGGVLGGLFNTLAAPLLFIGIVEYPLALAAAAALRPSPAFRRGAPEGLQMLVGLPGMVLCISAVFWALGLFGPVKLSPPRWLPDAGLGRRARPQQPAGAGRSWRRRAGVVPGGGASARRPAHPVRGPHVLRRPPRRPGRAVPSPPARRNDARPAAPRSDEYVRARFVLPRARVRSVSCSRQRVRVSTVSASSALAAAARSATDAKDSSGRSSRSIRPWNASRETDASSRISR